MHAPGCPRRHQTARLLAVLASAGLIVAVPAGAGPAFAGNRTPTCRVARPAPAGDLVIPVVVDRNTSVLVSCVPVPAGSTGSQVLTIRAQLLGRPPPRYNDAGLLCGIDGYPATGCGNYHAGHYAYWAYFHGGARWRYANGGPAAWKVFPGDVEGWRYEPRGAANSTDPPPRAAPRASALVPPATSVAPTKRAAAASGPAHGGTAGGVLTVGLVAALIVLLAGGAAVRARRAAAKRD